MLSAETPCLQLNNCGEEDITGCSSLPYKEREEIPDLALEDGTCKIFLNMTSKNGRPELVSLLQYMKYTSLDNEDVTEKDDRILDLDKIVREVKQSEEWEAVEMNIFEIGVEHGKELGIEEGKEQGIEHGTLKTLVRSVELSMKNFHMNMQEACEGLEILVEEYEDAKQRIALWEEDNTK